MFGLVSLLVVAKLDYDMFGCPGVLNWFHLKLEVGAFDSRNDFNTQIYCSAYFYMNASKRKSFYLQLTFNHNQFYKINICQYITKHTLSSTIIWDLQCLFGITVGLSWFFWSSKGSFCQITMAHHWESKHARSQKLELRHAILLENIQTCQIDSTFP